VADQLAARSTQDGHILHLSTKDFPDATLSSGAAPCKGRHAVVDRVINRLQAVTDSYAFDRERDPQFSDAPPGAGGEPSCQSST
jgi:hypothetical protein